MPSTLHDISGVGASTAEMLNANNIDSVKKLAKIDIKQLTLIPGIGEVSGRNMIRQAKELLAKSKPDNKKDKGKKGKGKKGKGKKGKGKKGKGKKGKK